MPLIDLIIVLIIVGVLLWAVNQLIPLDPTIKTVINVVIVLALVLWLLSALGTFGHRLVLCG